ncbi:hypothetical protein, partial [Moritella viscosa]|uniref:hypothetical protein n=1 Tax=Moritella viscosa TaxID=80854 RepID=UPI000A6BBE14
AKSAATAVTLGKAGDAPVASNINIDKLSPTVGELLTGTYDFTDIDGDLEGISTFKWYANNTEILGATGLTYTLLNTEEGKTITFSVMPVASTGTPLTGTEQKSQETDRVGI